MKKFLDSFWDFMIAYGEHKAKIALKHGFRY